MSTTEQTREALNDAIQEFEGNPHWYLDLLADHERAIRADELRKAAADLWSGTWPIDDILGVRLAIRELDARADRIEEGKA